MEAEFKLPVNYERLTQPQRRKVRQMYMEQYTPIAMQSFGSTTENDMNNKLVEGTPKVHNKYKKTVPEGAVYVGRGSPWGNPFVIGEHGTRDEVIDRFVEEVLPTLDVTALKGKHLVCFCKPSRCHADYLLEKANKL